MGNPSELLLDHLDLLTALDRSLPVLDLACGTGRNGLLVAEQGLKVVFADRSSSALDTVAQRLRESGLRGQTWQVDLEQADVNPFAGSHYTAVLGFCYLHRPLFPLLKQAVIPGGLVIAQDPDSAQYDGMPRSAIATGMVDVVRSVEAIPDVLCSYLQHAYIQEPDHPQTLLAGADDMRSVLALLQSHTGHDFRAYKKGTLGRRMASITSAVWASTRPLSVHSPSRQSTCSRIC